MRCSVNCGDPFEEFAEYKELDTMVIGCPSDSHTFHIATEEITCYDGRWDQPTLICEKGCRYGGRMYRHEEKFLIRCPSSARTNSILVCLDGELVGNTSLDC